MARRAKKLMPRKTTDAGADTSDDAVFSSRVKDKDKDKAAGFKGGRSVKKKGYAMGGAMMKKGYKRGGKTEFPDLTGDGKVTQADILKGRGVKSAKGGGMMKKKGMKKGGKVRGAGIARKGVRPAKMR